VVSDEASMTLGRRMAMLFKAKASTALEPCGGSTRNAGLSDAKQLELLQQVRRGGD